MLSALAGAVGLDDEDDGDCRCTVTFDDPPDAPGRDGTLRVDADGCSGRGDLVAEPACRETVVDALTDRDARAVRTRVDGIERSYVDGAAALLVAAGRFVDRVAVHDAAIAERARRDPLAAAHEATGRAGPVSRIAAECGLAAGAERVEGYETALRPFVSPVLSRCRVALRPPEGATLRGVRDLPTGASVRRYETPEGSLYQLVPVWSTLDRAALSSLEAARRRLATGAVDGGERAPERAVRAVADPEHVEALGRLLRKHVHGHGLLDDLFADERVTDVFVTAPVTETHVRVTVDGERLGTNLQLSPEGAAALASRFRRRSGRGFSRAAPTLDAILDAPDGRQVRVAGVAPPASEGLGFTFRTHDAAPWTLPRLVDRGTLTAGAAALLSLAVERGVAGLVCGPRGAGKTTTLGALLFELPKATRSVVVEDTPELPVDALREAGRDVQPLRTTVEDGRELTPTEALRTALRLGDGALVVGEVRGEEATTLYEAMRVGATDGAVLGTVHGEGAEAVRERVVADLGVTPAAFAATDLVVSLTDENGRRVSCVEEVRGTGEECHAVSLFEVSENELVPTGVVERGDSALVAGLTRVDESYADVLDRLDDRRARFERLVAAGLTTPADREAASW